MFEKTSETAGIDENTAKKNENKTSAINKANKSYPRIFVFHDLLWSLDRVIFLAKLANYGVEGKH